MRCRTSPVGRGEAMVRPQASVQLDYEAELVAVVGRTARHVAREKAFDYIAGYSCFNDGSVRDYQRKTSQWTIGKNFDETGGLGTRVVRADDLPPGPAGLFI